MGQARRSQPGSSGEDRGGLRSSPGAQRAVVGSDTGPRRRPLYDSSWAAAAQALRCPLVSGDRLLLSAGLAITATEAAAAPGPGV